MREFVMTLLVCSATMSILGFLYMAATPLLARRYSAKSRYYAWLIVVIGLIVPFRPHFGGGVIHYDLPPAVVYPIAEQSNAIMAITPSEIVTPAETVTPSEVTAPSVTAPSVSLWQMAASAWMIGMIAYIVYHAVKHHRFSKMAARWSENVTNERALSVLENIKSEMGIARDIGLYQCPNVGSPTLIGIVNPRILLPQADFTQDELAFILRHELTHYRRGDLWYKCAALLAAAIHWFNPIVYLLAKAIDAACELSCDAETVLDADVDTLQRYCETIIGVVRYQSKLKTALSTTFYGGKRGMKKRIYSIMDTGKKKTGIAILCCLLLLTLGTGMAFATNANKQKHIPLYQLYDQLGAQENNIALGGTETYSISSGSGYTETAYDYSKYAPYGLSYDSSGNTLYYKGERVRNFEDWYPLGENMMAGMSHFDNEGTIDVHAVRDFSKIVYNPDGSYDPSGILMGVEPDSQVTTPNLSGRQAQYQEFGLIYDEKDHTYKFQGKLVRYFEDYYLNSQGAKHGSNYINEDGEIDIYTECDENGTIIGIKEYDDDVWGSDAFTTKLFYDESISASVPTMAMSGATDTWYEPYAEYGLTYDKKTDTLYFYGDLVRYFEDNIMIYNTQTNEASGTLITHYPIPKDNGGLIDVYAVRSDDKIELLRLELADKETYDEMTKVLDEKFGNTTAVSQSTGASYSHSTANQLLANAAVSVD